MGAEPQCVSAPVRVPLARLPWCCETSDTPGSWAPAPPRCPNRCRIPRVTRHRELASPRPRAPSRDAGRADSAACRRNEAAASSPPPRRIAARTATHRSCRGCPACRAFGCRAAPPAACATPARHSTHSTRRKARARARRSVRHRGLPQGLRQKQRCALCAAHWPDSACRQRPRPPCRGAPAGGPPTATPAWRRHLPLTECQSRRSWRWWRRASSDASWSLPPRRVPRAARTHAHVLAPLGDELHALPRGRLGVREVAGDDDSLWAPEPAQRRTRECTRGQGGRLPHLHTALPRAAKNASPQRTTLRSWSPPRHRRGNLLEGCAAAAKARARERRT